ncbi:MAG: hypothetical protein JJT75_05350 [Opitutales bacterium]|nr:hypothetical protein [Opitutales bacterium]MCH8541335.1 hypothetical protein [Opitutales bacterium]
MKSIRPFIFPLILLTLVSCKDNNGEDHIDEIGSSFHELNREYHEGDYDFQVDRFEEVEHLLQSYLGRWTLNFPGETQSYRSAAELASLRVLNAFDDEIRFYEADWARNQNIVDPGLIEARFGSYLSVLRSLEFGEEALSKRIIITISQTLAGYGAFLGDDVKFSRYLRESSHELPRGIANLVLSIVSVLDGDDVSKEFEYDRNDLAQSMFKRRLDNIRGKLAE